MSVESITIKGLEYRYFADDLKLMVHTKNGGWKLHRKFTSGLEAERAIEGMKSNAGLHPTSETLPAHTTPPTAVAPADADAAALRLDFEQAEMAERDACLRYVRIGLRCLRKKDSLPHGQFLNWLAGAINQVRQRKAQRYMQIAQAFIEEKKLAGEHVAALCGDAATPAAQEAEQLLLKFIDGRPMTQLLSDLARPKLGGARPGAGRKPNTNEYLREAAEAHWRGLLNQLHLDTTSGKPNRQYARLGLPLLKQISAQLRDTKRVIDTLIAKG